MPFNIQDFNKNSITKFYYDKGRHAATSLRIYKNKLYVHKLLGSAYRAVSENEYKKIIDATIELSNFLRNNADLKSPKVAYLGYNRANNCIERVEEYSGITLQYAYPTSNVETREEIVNLLLDKLGSIVRINDFKIDFKYSIDPTPDNFTYDGTEIYYIDFMPPLIRGKKIDAQFISDKSRNSSDLSTQMFRYFTQKGMYLTFLTKFGANDISNFHNLFKKTLKTIHKKEVVDYIYNADIKKIEVIVGKSIHYQHLNDEITLTLNHYQKEERDLLRLMGVYFINDFNKIIYNATKYRVTEVVDFLQGKRCAADIIKELIYSDLRKSSMHEELKSILIELISLQYAK